MATLDSFKQLFYKSYDFKFNTFLNSLLCELDELIIILLIKKFDIFIGIFFEI